MSLTGLLMYVNDIFFSRFLQTVLTDDLTLLQFYSSKKNIKIILTDPILYG